jgi:hypothetical protein
LALTTACSERITMMDWSLTFIVGSLIFGLAVIIGANVWAIKGDRASELDPSLDSLMGEIYEHLDRQAGNTQLERNVTDAKGDGSPPR